MLDLETLGTKPGSVIMSLAAIQFDLKTGKLGAEYYRNIDLPSSKELGLEIDQDTIDWWNKQDRSIYNQMFVKPLHVKVVLNEFSLWIKTMCPGAKFVWGNAPSFDCVLLRTVYDRAHIGAPWAFYNERCVRTIVGLNPAIKDSTPKPAAAHHPIVDCRHQINYLVKTLNSLK